MSKKLSPLIIIAFCSLAACKDRTGEKKDTAVKAQIDSLASARLMEINMQAMDQLDRRMSIEIKEKADSIVAARDAKAAGIVAPPPTAPAAPQRPGL